MKYQVTKKVIPEKIVYTAENVLKTYSDSMQWIPLVGQECLKLNPDMKCAEPPYEFGEYLDGEYKETDVRIRHNEAVTAFGKESELSVIMKKTGVLVEKNFVNSKMCSSDADETGKMSSSLSSDALRDGCFDVKSEHT